MSLPDIADAISDLGDPVELAVIAKSVSDFEEQETITSLLAIYGVLIPTPERKLLLMPEGERRWKFWDFYSSAILELDWFVRAPDHIQYRVMSYEDWSGAGYRKYTLKQTLRAGGAA